MRHCAVFVCVVGSVLVGWLATPARANTVPTPTPIPTAPMGGSDPFAASAAQVGPLPPPTPSAVPQGTDAVGMPAGDPSTGHAAIVPQPSGAWPTTPTAGPQDQTIEAMVCIDPNANRWCDGDEGLRGMTLVAQDADTGRVLAVVVSDQTGSAQFTLRVRAHQGVTIAAPYLGTLHTVRDGGPVDQFIVSDVPALPALLP